MLYQLIENNFLRTLPQTRPQKVSNQNGGSPKFETFELQSAAILFGIVFIEFKWHILFCLFTMKKMTSYMTRLFLIFKGAGPHPLAPEDQIWKLWYKENLPLLP